MTRYRVGPAYVPSYQISSIPYVTSSVSVGTGSATQVSFYNITRFITVKNSGANALRIGFSSNGVSNNNYIELPSSGDSFTGEFRVSDIYLISDGGATTVDVIAGLTNIQVTDQWTNWTGSAGVG